MSFGGASSGTQRTPRRGGPTSPGCRNGRTSSTPPGRRTCGSARPTPPTPTCERCSTPSASSELAGQPPGGTADRARPRRAHRSAPASASALALARALLQPGAGPPARRTHRVARPPHRGAPRHRPSSRGSSRPHRPRGGARARPAPPLRRHRRAARASRGSRWRSRREPAARCAPPRPRRPGHALARGSPWPGCSAWPRPRRPSACWRVRATWWAGPRCGPGLSAIVGILAAVEVLAFLRGPLRYDERLVGHDAALRALTRWRVLALRLPRAAGAGRPGRVAQRRPAGTGHRRRRRPPGPLPPHAAAGGDRRGRRRARRRWPSASSCPGPPSPSGLPLAVALDRAGRCSPGGAAATTRWPALAGALSAQVVDALAGAPELLAFGADDATLRAVEELAARADALERRHARPGHGHGAGHRVCLAAAVVGGARTRRRRRPRAPPGPGHGGRAPPGRAGDLRDGARVCRWRWPGPWRCAPRPSASSRSRTCRSRCATPTLPRPAAPGVPEVAFEDAALRYGSGLPRALDGISLRLPPGGRLAVTGSSGAGKSSLVNALLRYWPLEEGTLSLGGTDVERLTQTDDPGRVRAGGPTGPDVRGHGALQPHPRPARRHRGRDRGCAARGAARRMGGRAARTVSTRRSARTEWRSREASADASPWPAPCSPRDRVLVLDEPTSGLDPGLGRRADRGRARRRRRTAACSSSRTGPLRRPAATPPSPSRPAGSCRLRATSLSADAGVDGDRGRRGRDNPMTPLEGRGEACPTRRGGETPWPRRPGKRGHSSYLAPPSGSEPAWDPRRLHPRGRMSKPDSKRSLTLARSLLNFSGGHSSFGPQFDRIHLVRQRID